VIANTLLQVKVNDGRPGTLHESVQQQPQKAYK